MWITQIQPNKKTTCQPQHPDHKVRHKNLQDIDFNLVTIQSHDLRPS